MRNPLIAVLSALLLVAALSADVLQLREVVENDSPMAMVEQARLLGPASGAFVTRLQPRDWKSPLLAPEATVTELLPNGDFESGPSVWTEASLNGWALILDSRPVEPHSGDWLVWLGGDYDEIAYIEQEVTVPSSAPYFKYWHWIASEDFCGYDLAGVVVNSTIVVDVYDLCDDNDTGGWVLYSVNMAAYAGQTIDIQIRVETDDSLNSNLFVDDVFFEFDALAEAIFTDDFESGDTTSWSSTVQ